MKKMSFEEQIEQILHLYEMSENRISYMWEEHLEYINWNKNSEFYEPYFIFTMRYIWEILKEYRIENAYTSYNKIMTYLYNNIEECEKIKKSEGINEGLYSILDIFLSERSIKHHRKFDKEYNQNLYYTHEKINIKKSDKFQIKYKINFENLIINYFVPFTIVLILIPIFPFKLIYDFINNLIYKWKNRNIKDYDYYYN